MELLRSISRFASYKGMLPLILLPLLYIMLYGKHKNHEVLFYIMEIFSGEILDEILRRVFHCYGPNGNILNTFLSEYALVSLVIYGFSAFLILSYLKNRFLKSSIIFMILAMLFSIGLSEIYFKLQYPSDIIAGYAFGGVCLSFNIFIQGHIYGFH